MKPLKKVVIILLFAVPINANALWEVRNNTPTTAQITSDFQFNKSVAGVLLVNFIPEMSCTPEVSFTMLEGGSASLGSPVGQALANGKMSLWVDGKLVWNDRTAVTKYTNAIETGGMANSALVNKLMLGDEVVVQQLPDMPKFAFSLKGSSTAIKKAKANCR
ncbi:MAG: hypothetical protein QNL62_20585 [Gammaproteobacteria bacterium]|nr:hypothetical protein [Gammaproteobacteria bacterium]